MNSSGAFWKMVQHEFKLKGSWKRRIGPQFSRGWMLLYVALIVIAGAGLATYYALKHQMELNQLWVVVFGFPYALIVFGIMIVKKEWENETYGWWLTLPYSRLWLLRAKWVAIWMRMMVVLLGISVLLSVYAIAISLALGQYSMEDVGSFILTGLRWLFLIIGSSPLLLSLGMLVATLRYSLLRPLSPILWAAMIAIISLGYGNFGKMFVPDTWAGHVYGGTRFPLSWESLAGMAVSWIAAWFIIRFAAYVLDRKLTL